MLFKQFAKKTTKKPRHFHLKTAMSDGFYGMTQRKNPWHETNKTSASPKKNCAYSTYSTVFVDKWVDCLFGSFAHLFYGGGGWVPVCGFCSDLDQNRAILWSKSEMKHLKHPKHLKHLKHFLWMFGLLFCQHFKELGGKVKDGVHRRQDQKGMLLVLGWIVAIAPIRMNGIVGALNSKLTFGCGWGKKRLKTFARWGVVFNQCSYFSRMLSALRAGHRGD